MTVAGEREQPSAQVREVAEPMLRWERAAALCAGLVLGVVGCVAVFISENQAGTTALLLAAAVFLLIGIQGTLLVRVSGGSNTAEFERRLRQEEFIERVTEEAETNPERAQGMVEAASILVPTLSPFIDDFGYEQLVGRALHEAGHHSIVRRVSQDGPVDFVINAPEGPIFVMARFKPSGKLRAKEVIDFRNRVTSAGTVGGLVVTNVQLTRTAAELLSGITGTGPVEAVTWAGESDVASLATAIERVRRTAKDHRAEVPTN